MKVNFNNILNFTTVRRRFCVGLAFIILCVMQMAAQTQTYRFVSPDGNNANDGLSWATAVHDVQNAVYSLAEYIGEGQTGTVYVAAGTYLPTTTTEQSGDGQHNTSFIIPAGITVYGGFAGTETAADLSILPTLRVMSNGKTQAENDALSPEERVPAWEFQNKTILSGRRSETATQGLIWDSASQQYKEIFPSNSYHVVWFATAGFYNPEEYGFSGAEADKRRMRAKRLAKPAVLDGVTVTGGYASYNDVSRRNHASYGGGVYMVDGSCLRKSIVTDNAALLRGGGVYCDGGGDVEECLVIKNQARGSGITEGYGGGVCVDFYGSVRASVITENAARVGGGLAITHELSLYPHSADNNTNFNAFAPYAATCIVVSNTATAEGGGILMKEGGTLNDMTVVRNHCAGPNVSYNSRRYGRSGGLYVDVGATVFNSVFWGNTTRTNGEMQYAAYINRSINSGVNVSPYINYSAFSNFENIDWTGTSRLGVIGIENVNARPISTRKSSVYYPEFVNPSNSVMLAGIPTAGVEAVGATYSPETDVTKNPVFSVTPGEVTPGTQLSLTCTTSTAKIYYTINGNDPDASSTQYTAPITINQNMIIKAIAIDETLGESNVSSAAYTVPDAEVASETHTTTETLGTATFDFTNPTSLSPSYDAPSNNSSTSVNEKTFTKKISGVDVKVKAIGNNDNSVQIHTNRLGMTYYSLNKATLTISCTEGYYITNITFTPVTFTQLTNLPNWDANTNEVVYEKIFKDASGIINNIKVTVAKIETTTTIPATAPIFTPSSGTVANGKSVSIISDADAQVYYTIDGSTPSEFSTLYENPITIENTTILRAIAVPPTTATNKKNSKIVSVGYTVKTDDKTPTTSTPTPQETPDYFKDWQPHSYSDLMSRGISIIDYVTKRGVEVAHAAAKYDINRNPLSAVTVLGARVGVNITIKPANMKSLEDPTQTIATIFVDPNYNRASAEIGRGNSWNNPLVFIGDALSYASERADKSQPLQIFVKEGTSKVHNRRSNIENIDPNTPKVRLRDLTASISSNIRVYGGFYEELKGTDVTERNPMDYPSILSGNVIDLGYNKSSAHVVTIDNCENVILDGLKIYYGNTTVDENMLEGQVWRPATANGAGILINGGNNIQIRNCAIAYNTSDKGQGAGVYANGTTNLRFDNVVINNNTAKPADASDPAAVMLVNTPQALMQHNLIRGNIGGITVDGASASLSFTHSAMHANMNDAEFDGERVNDLVSAHMDYRLTISFTNGASAYKEGTDPTKSCDYNLFDFGITIPAGFGTNSHHIFTYNRGDAGYPEFVNPTSVIGAHGGVSTTVYGGIANFTPQNSNPMVNYIPFTESDKTDFTTLHTRNYGGAADVGPFENTDQQEFGKVIYVRDYGNTTDPGGDGSSWAKAINGNCNTSVYANNHNFEGYDAELYPEDTQLTGLQWAVDEAYHRSLQKTGNTINYKDITGFNIYTNGRYPTNNQSKLKVSTIDGDKRVEVWVAQGEYLRPDGFFMRDGVDVYGGFPPTGNPTHKERAPKEYETAIQTNTDEQIESNSFSWGPQTEDASGYGNYTVKNTYDLNRYSNAYKSRRVLTQQFPYYYGTNLSNRDTQNGMEFGNRTVNAYKFRTTWNGFTIKNGRCQITHQRDGGAGVSIRDNGIIENCVVTNNQVTGRANLRGGGIFNNGGEIVNCDINNNVIFNPGNKSNMNIYGGGLYLRSGIVYNTTFYDNKAYVVGEESAAKANYCDGSGAYFENGRFYNNTIVRNRGGNGLGTGNWFDNGSLVMYNCLIYGNYDNQTTTDFSNIECEARAREGNNPNITISHCFFRKGKASVSAPESMIDNKISNFIGDDGSTGLNLDPSFKDATSAIPDFRLTQESVCINKALEVMMDGSKYIELPDVDADYTDRVKDCALDVGAYEFDGTTSIAPNVVDNKMIFYVSNTGYGLRTAKSPDNAACWQKLQKVLDVAGQYRVNPANSDKEVVVRLAEYDGYRPVREALYNGDGKPTNSTNSNPRDYSIIVPRGVIVEGGWNESFTQREPLIHKTVLNGAYQNDGNETNAYHVVRFSKAVYGSDGKPAENQLITSGRAILDGLFISNGIADGDIVEKTEAMKPETIDNYLPANFGGAAVVPSYAHIRNCVIENNSSSTGGGGLFLLPKALVSGSIFRENTTDGDGGGVYVYEPADEEKGSFTEIDPATLGNLPPIPHNEYPYANIFTSTFSGNSAGDGGGAIYFGTNLRMNSSVLWQNSANNNSNIAGIVNPGSTSAGSLQPWEYPLQYCAIENMRASGFNNRSVSADEGAGVRWDRPYDNGKYGDFYYALDNYSVLARTGMIQTQFEAISQNERYFPTLESNDIANVNRTGHPDNIYIEIGARSIDSDIKIPIKTELTRLFVAQADDPDANINAARALENSHHEIYSIRGSSMAYPMNSLTEALEYIRDVRKEAAKEYHAAINDAGREAAQAKANMKFEVFVARGTYYPQRTITGTYSTTRANTFLVPEGVAIYGGIDLKTNLCQEKEGTSITIGTVTLTPKSTNEILTSREVYDVNGNGIIEGWGLEHQTILSGDMVNSDESHNVFHIINCIAAEEYVGLLPTPTKVNDSWNGSSYKERGWPIVFDGLQITGGEAMHYDAGVVSTSTFYKGGALCVDGNWMSKYESGVYSDDHKELAGHNFNEMTDDQYYATKRWVGYRDIPVMVRNSLITGNKASLGGAIFTNGSMQIYSSQISQNIAEATHDKIEGSATFSEGTVHYARGGAINANSLLVLTNCIMANNTVTHGELPLVDVSGNTTGENDAYLTVYGPSGTPNTKLAAAGGAISVGEHGSLEMVNCNVVNNLSDTYPALYTVGPNQGYKAADLDNSSINLFATNPHMIVNSLFWGNRANIDDGGTYGDIINEKTASSNDIFNETFWFSAYESGRWHEPLIAPDDGANYRRIPWSDVKGSNELVNKNLFVPKVMHVNNPYNANDKNPIGVPDIHRYNFNVTINADNDAPDGPNFIAPSLVPGVTGYQQDADWMLSLNNDLVDRGWTYLEQDYTSDKPMFKFSTTQPTTGLQNMMIGNGIYYNLAYLTNANGYYDDYINMPIGGEEMKDATNGISMTYMAYAGNSSQMSALSPIYRISYDPNPNHYQTYIDIGAYEYQHVALKPSESEEVDVVWVGREIQGVGEHDGSTWEKSTSDLQRAIETLLASRNDHAKEIRLLEGTYSPRITLGSNKAYTINTGHVNKFAKTPANESINKAYGVKSLTIRGGYSDHITNRAIYSVKDYPVNLTMQYHAGQGEGVMQHIIIVEDARQFTTTKDNNTHTPTGKVIPITIEGVTFTNPYAKFHVDSVLVSDDNITSEKSNGGAAIFYKPQKNYAVDKTDPEYGKYLLAPTDESDNELPKLTIANCTFIKNGDDTASDKEKVPALTIARGGGEALVFNSVFARNTGSPFYAVDTKFVNNTFALNGSQLKFGYGENDIVDRSELHNSIVWRNRENNSAQTHDIGGWPASVTNNAIYVQDDDVDYDNVISFDETSKNSILNDDNTDFDYGPNFTDPDNDDYSVLPSISVTGKADYSKYQSLVGINEKETFDQGFDENDPMMPTEVEYTENESSGAHATGYMKYHDLSGQRRLIDDEMERGAYESSALLRRVLYVDPGSVNSVVTGDNWSESYGSRDLQTAINTAAVFSAVNNIPSYVFVKANYSFSEESRNENLGDVILRNGVNIYGSIPVLFNDVATRDVDNTINDTENIKSYIESIKYIPTRAMARTSSTHSLVSGISASGNVAATFDGFVVCPTDETELTSSPIKVNLTSGTTVISNAIVRDFKVKDASLIDLSGNVLLYNSLVRDNSISSTTAINYPAIALGNNTNSGFVLNCTVAMPEGMTFANGININTTTSNVRNTISYVGDVLDDKTTVFAPYFHKKDFLYQSASFANPMTENKNLWYQLPEQSPYLESGQTSIDWPIDITSLYDFENDRDLLGNPRMINRASPTRADSWIDYGCFETWTTGSPLDESFGIQTAIPADVVLYPNTDPEVLGGNYYPHEGSVVYIQAGGTIVLGKDGEGNPWFTEENFFQPGYLLLREGGSLYGQGNSVRLSYVAVQRNLKKQYALVSMPFDFLPLKNTDGYYTTVAEFDYGDQGRVIANGFNDSKLAMFTYNGTQRMQHNYKFNAEDSPCWKPIALNTRIPATEGWLMDLKNETSKNRFVRFTAFGYKNTQTGEGTSTDPTVQLALYPYREGKVLGNITPKEITLDKNDIDGNDVGAQFTHEYHQGWNLRGLPLMISDYRLFDNDKVELPTYAMNAPHIIYKLNDDNGYETTESWNETTGKISVGRSFFTQTSIVNGDKETVNFQVPEYTASSSSEAPRKTIAISKAVGTRSESLECEDAVEIRPDTDGDGSLSYRVGVDGAKLLALNDELAQIYAVGNEQLRMALVADAPLDTDIPLGVIFPDAGNYTLSLPDVEAWTEGDNAMSVWLIDRQAQTVTNLTEGTYSVSVSEAGDVPDRFSVRLGAMPSLNGDDGREYRVEANDGTIRIGQLKEGDKISIFSVDGYLITSATATGADFECQVPRHKAYIVRINSYVTKVLP